MPAFSEARLRIIAAIVLSTIFVVRAGFSLIYFALGGDGEVDPDVHAFLIVAAALGTCAAVAALILSISRWRKAGAARRGPLGALWLGCVALMLLEWTASLVSSG
jgi:hypothetical protein